MKGPLFHWGVVFRYVVYGALPFVGALWLFERFLGDAGVGAAIVVLAALLPFYAIGWLGYQHWKHSRARPSTSSSSTENDD
jgi:hypothetical protein